jgi:hypothetical protein
MRRTFLATLLTALAVGCAPSPPAEISDNTTSSDVDVTIPAQPSEGGQTADAEADSNLTLVSLKVPGMT